MLDLERDRLRPIVDLADLCRRHCAGPERTEEGVRTRCLEKEGCCAAIFATQRGSNWEFESVDIRLLRVTFVL